MRKFIIGLSGVLVDLDGKRIGSMGSGKDTVADFMVKSHQARKVAMADPLKRICRDVYQFTEQQLWGPSAERNKPDPRYPRPKHVFVGNSYICDCCGWDEGSLVRNQSKPPQCYLTPRYALRLLGTEWGRTCYPDTWTNLAVETAKRIFDGMMYSQTRGFYQEDIFPVSCVVIPDVRFKNEIDFIQRGGGKVVRIIRPVDRQGSVDLHPSESEALEVPDSAFDCCIHNSSDLGNLKRSTDEMVELLSGKLEAPHGISNLPT